jgi:Sulfotransferase domain
VHLKSLVLSATAQLLRLIPGSTALRWKRDLRDAAWLSAADVVLVSYPKSGRTFVRAMVARLYQLRFGLDERDLLEFPKLKRAPPGVPRLLFTHAGDTMRGPIDIKLDERAYAHCRIVLLVRHPGDIAVSRYHHLKHRSRDAARRRLAEQPVDAFVWSEQGGIPSIVAFLNQWANLSRRRLGITIVRYEDFLSDPQATLRRLADAIGLAVGDDDIADAAEFGSYHNLKRLEQEGYFRSKRLRPAKADDAQSGKVRRGSSGGYREQLDDLEAERVDAYIREHLDPAFGYGVGGIS